MTTLTLKMAKQRNRKDARRRRAAFHVPTRATKGRRAPLAKRFTRALERLSALDGAPMKAWRLVVSERALARQGVA